MSKEELRLYTRNLSKFIASLPESSVRFLYFYANREKIGNELAIKEIIPTVNEVCKEWKTSIQSRPFYVIKNDGTDGYCYIYTESELKYKVTIDNYNIVETYQSDKEYAQFGGNHLTNVNWGDHLTVGLQISYVTRKLLLASHLTSYVVLEEEPNIAQTNRIECNVYFSENIEDNSQCIINGALLGMSLSTFYKPKHVIPVLKRLKNIYTGKPTSIQYGGSKVYLGPNGGRFIKKNNKNIYLRKLNQKGGTNDPFLRDGNGVFNDTFVRFIQEYVLNKISSAKRNFSGASIIYDTEAYGFMIRYMFGENDLSETHFFYLEKGMVANVMSYVNLSEIQKESLPESERIFNENEVQKFNTIIVSLSIY